ncbi:hypothetical protein BT69DRAFT_1350946 [Atractiella rhizophila]|nr:hypothetical protein BT69DRAFT_1350946 [Atractiella rhizophila]
MMADQSEAKPPFDAFHHPDYASQSIGPVAQLPFDSFKAPDYTQQSFVPSQPGPIPFDPLKPPPYELQTFDSDELKKKIRGRNVSISEADEKERGRHPIRNASGSTSNRSVSRGNSLISSYSGIIPTSEPAALEDGQQSQSQRNASQSPSRAMGARSGSISRFQWKTLDEQPQKGEEFGVKRRASISTGGRSGSITSLGRSGSVTSVGRSGMDGVREEGGVGEEERGRK